MRIRKKCEAEKKPYIITVGIGIDELDKSEEDAFAAGMKRADDRMYEDKERHKKSGVREGER